MCFKQIEVLKKQKCNASFLSQNLDNLFDYSARWMGIRESYSSTTILYILFPYMLPAWVLIKVQAGVVFSTIRLN